MPDDERVDQPAEPPTGGPEQPPTGGPEQPPAVAPPPSGGDGSLWAFLPIGVTFMVIGMTQGLDTSGGGLTFFIIGLAFITMALSTGASPGRRGHGAARPPDGAPDGRAGGATATPDDAPPGATGG